MNESVSYEEYLEKYGFLSYSNVGVSMLPLLRQGKDLFIARKKGPERCKKGDVVLYRRPPDQYVLHRIVEVRPDDYVILGDNCIRREYGITDEDIIGLMSGFVREGKEHTVSEFRYRFYSFAMLHLIVLRIPVKKAEIKLRYRLRRLLGKSKP